MRSFQPCTQPSPSLAFVASRAAFVGVVLAAVFANGHGVIAGLIIVVWLLFAVVWILRAKGSVPKTWPRWRLAEGHLKRRAPAGKGHAQ